MKIHSAVLSCYMCTDRLMDGAIIKALSRYAHAPRERKKPRKVG
jgi:hypothetical protein